MFKELCEKEEVLYLTNGHATNLGKTNFDETIWNVMDYESDECYLLVGDEIKDLEPFIDTEFYRLRHAINECKKRHQIID